MRHCVPKSIFLGITLARSQLRVSFRVEMCVSAMAPAKLVCRPRNFDVVELFVAHPWLLTKKVRFGSEADTHIGGEVRIQQGLRMLSPE